MVKPFVPERMARPGFEVARQFRGCSGVSYGDISNEFPKAKAGGGWAAAGIMDGKAGVNVVRHADIGFGRT